MLSGSRGLLLAFLEEERGAGRFGLACKSLKCRIRGLTLDPDPAGWALEGMALGRALGRAVGRGVSREGWTRANPKKIPVRPSSFSGPSDESGRLAMNIQFMSPSAVSTRTALTSRNTEKPRSPTESMSYSAFQMDGVRRFRPITTDYHRSGLP